jgi:serine/threonine protein kinase
MIIRKSSRTAPEPVFRDLNGRSIQLGRRLGAGGEAEVFAIEGNESLVAKIYKLPSPDRERKLQAMIQNMPVDPTLSSGHRSICWPETLLYDSRNYFAGFLMSRVDFTTNRQLLAFYNPISRQRISIELTWQHLVRVAMNVCSVMEAIHSQGHIIGDVNESNFLVSNSARVTLVDCDSFQILDQQRGVRFRCPVGKAEFTPPELQDRDFSSIDRDIAHDNFSLGVITFLLLMEGVHPFMGSWRGYGNAPQLHENIKDGRFPYGNGGVLVPSPIAPPLEMLPTDIRTLFDRCFVKGHGSPKERPSPAEWQRALKRLDGSLQVCRNNGHHVYSGHMTQCPWCPRAAQLGGLDPFPLTAPVERPRATAVATAGPVLQPAPRRKIAAPSMTAVFYALFTLVSVAAIAGWLAFNSNMDTVAADWWYGPTPKLALPIVEIVQEEEEEPAEVGVVQQVRREPARARRREAEVSRDPNIVALETLRAPAVVQASKVVEPVAAAVREVAAAPQPAAPVRREKIFAAKHKHRLIGGCEGVLTLTPEGIRFTSAEHSFTLEMGEIELDEDGIKDDAGKNWHFSVKDLNVKELLRDWKDGTLEF